jgi:NAD(P)-dependent dehydrogenase (short-subunit alcohol dehydrogenase family)
MTDLAGWTAVVAGATGGVGEGVVAALLEAGATVVATGRDHGRLRELTDRIRNEGLSAAGHLHTAVADALAPDLDSAVEALTARYGPPDLVVVSVASWGALGSTPVLQLADAEWDKMLRDNQTAVFRLYRAWWPRMSPRGLIVHLNGYSADLAFPHAAGVALSNAATKSLTVSLAAARRPRDPRVVELLLGVTRTRARRQAGIDDERWLTGTEIGAHVAALAAGTSPLADIALHYFIDRTSGPRATPPERGS